MIFVGRGVVRENGEVNLPRPESVYTTIPGRSLGALSVMPALVAEVMMG